MYIWIKNEYINEFEYNRFTAKPIPIFTSKTKASGKDTLIDLGYNPAAFTCVQIENPNIRKG